MKKLRTTLLTLAVLSTGWFWGHAAEVDEGEPGFSLAAGVQYWSADWQSYGSEAKANAALAGPVLSLEWTKLSLSATYLSGDFEDNRVYSEFQGNVKWALIQNDDPLALAAGIGWKYITIDNDRNGIETSIYGLTVVGDLSYSLPFLNEMFAPYVQGEVGFVLFDDDQPTGIDEVPVSGMVYTMEGGVAAAPLEWLQLRAGYRFRGISESDAAGDDTMGGPFMSALFIYMF